MSNFVILNLELDPQTADPAAPPDGLVWYNSTLGQYRIRKGGTTHNIADITYVDEQIAAAIQGLSWQDPVIAEQSAPPGSPSTGDRYIVTPTGTGAWAGQDNSIAEWNGASWDFIVPDEGFVLYNDTTNKARLFSGTAWGNFDAIVDHNALQNLTVGNPHTQYLLVSGATPMTGDLDMGGNSITNVNLVDGVDVSDHAARHINGGADVIDGDQLDITYVPTNYTRDITPGEVTNVNQLTAHLAGLDTAIAGVAADDMKSGQITAFAGNPKTATVTFATAYPDANYSVQLTQRTGGSKQYSVSVIAKTAASFTVQVAANNIGDLTAVDWVTKPYLDP